MVKVSISGEYFVGTLLEHNTLQPLDFDDDPYSGPFVPEHIALARYKRIIQRLHSSGPEWQSYAERVGVYRMRSVNAIKVEIEPVSS